jgi:hypothetical protein
MENALRLTHCMRCGYSLESLPAEGICPECGISFDQHTVVLYGHWSGRGDHATRSRGDVIGQSVILGFLILIAIHEARNGRYGSLIFPVSMLASLGVMMFWRFSARRAGMNGALVQCRFNSFGCLQCDLPEETVGVGDPRRIWTLLGIGGAFICLLVWSTIGKNRSPWTGCIILVVAAVVGGFSWRRRVSRRKKTEGNPDAQTLMVSARERGFAVIATPWADIASIRIGQFPRQTTRWYLTSNRAARFQTGQPINAEVEAEPEQIRELKSRIAAWKDAAGG